jgi:hypothetical protein
MPRSALAMEIRLEDVVAASGRRRALLSVLQELDACLEACEERHLRDQADLDEELVTRVSTQLREVASHTDDDRLMRAAITALDQPAALVRHLHDTLFLVEEVVLDLLEPRRHDLPVDIDCRGRASYAQLDPVSRLEATRRYRRRPCWMGAPAA